MFCLYGWLYILLFLIALVGALHGSIRIGKVALIVWGIIQTMAFTSIPQRQEFTPFLNYPTLQKKLIPTKKYSNSKQTPNFTFSGVKLGACFVKYRKSMFNAVRTGLEPVTPCVTGMYSNQLN